MVLLAQQSLHVTQVVTYSRTELLPSPLLQSWTMDCSESQLDMTLVAECLFSEER